MLVNSLKKVITYFGSTTKVARALGARQQSVSDWYRGRSEVPLDIALHLDLLMRGEVHWKDFVPFEIAYRLKNLCLSLKEAGVYPCELTHILMGRIIVPDFFTKNSKNQLFNMHRPPCLDENYTIIFGYGAFCNYQKNNKKTIPCWKLSIEKLAEGKYVAEDLEKAFSLMERTAIGIALKNFIGNRQGQRTDLLQNKEKQDSKQELRLNLDEVKGRTDQFVAKVMKFSSKMQFRQLEQIYQYGCDELIELVDQNKLAISKGASLAKLSYQEQKNKLTQ